TVEKITIGPVFAGSVWKIFSRASIRPSLDTTTRSGYGVWPRATRASRIFASGRPRRTLSCLSVLWPIKTASPSARCRNRCSLSSREVKSTGVKFFVVIFPSTVIAKVTATKGLLLLLPMWEGPLRPDFFERESSRDAKVPPTFFLLFLLADFMFEGGEFLLHLAH